jgi:hypothetical protein
MEVKLVNRPWFVMSLIIIILLAATWTVRNRFVINLFDTLFFTIIFILSFLMVFTNYLTDHQAMQSNYNMVWLNPLLLLTPVISLMKSPVKWFWRVQLFSVIVFMILIVFIRQAINPAFIPVMILLIARSWYRLNAE